MKPVIRVVALAALSAAILMSAAVAATAAPGDLDPSFGAGGIAAPAAPTDYSFGNRSAAMLPNGKFLTLAYEQYLGGPGNFAVQRANADGSLDTTFGDMGVARTTIANATPNSIAVAPSGQIIVVGTRIDSGTVSKIVVVAFDANGNLDPAFNGDGSNVCAGNGIVCSYMQSATGQNQARSVVVQPDGNIVVAGSVYESPGYVQTGVARLTNTGAFDTSFSGDGRAVVSMGAWGNYANAVALQPDGKIVIAGEADGKGLNFNAVDTYVNALGLIRLESNGNVDGTFHQVPSDYTGSPYSDGVVISPRSNWTYGSLSAMTVQPDGKIVATGYANDKSPGPTSSSLLAIRVDGTGVLDPSFGTGGRTFVDLGTFQGGYVATLDPSGRPVVAGYTDNGIVQQMFAARLTSSGVLDTSFNGTGAKVLADPQLGSTPTGVFFDSEQRMIVAGGAGGARYALIRLITAADAAPSPTATASVSITSPSKRSIKASKLRALAGTAGPAGSVKKVEIALQRKDSKLLKKHKRCSWLLSGKAKFKRTKASKGKCKKPYYRTASGTDSWKYRLTRKLPVGSYVLTARVTLLDGRTANKTYSFRLKK
ncbi:MAG: hypothetical protein JHC98_08870 [Thermoleophilaceae bacterium]|nr:hypothetical protein [Thermoleophilaceae bacterium]